MKILSSHVIVYYYSRSDLHSHSAVDETLHARQFIFVYMFQQVNHGNILNKSVMYASWYVYINTYIYTYYEIVS